MQEKLNALPFVSVIIPCYNAEQFISQTINSVILQTYLNFEIICINDGSNDSTEKLIGEVNDNRIVYLSKGNTGVSDTRNKGLKMSRGKYVLFLDADDLIDADFLEKRVQFLEQNNDFGFCSSVAIQMDEFGNKNYNKKWKGTTTNIKEEILTYNSEITSCPSNYLFRKDILINNSIQFNTDLSSSADRFFLIELSNFTKGGLVKENGFFYYRVHKKSMSYNISPDFVKDNVLFLKKILLMDNIPVKLKNEFSFKMNYIFAGGYFQFKQFIPCIWFSIKAFYCSPSGFFKQLFIKR